MTAHELARELLKMPDKEVRVHDTETDYVPTRLNWVNDGCYVELAEEEYAQPVHTCETFEEYERSEARRLSYERVMVKFRVSPGYFPGKYYTPLIITSEFETDPAHTPAAPPS